MAFHGLQEAPESRGALTGVYIHGWQCGPKNGRFSQSATLKTLLDNFRQLWIVFRSRTNIVCPKGLSNLARNIK